jgi:hypothetical protein
VMILLEILITSRPVLQGLSNKIELLGKFQEHNRIWNKNHIRLKYNVSELTYLKNHKFILSN